MDKKIILVLLILLVLAIYYCYTHESFTENFKSVAEIVKGGGVIENFDLASDGGTIKGDLKVSGEISAPVITARNSNGIYKLIAGEDKWNGGVSANALDIHAYKGDGTYKGLLATFRNNGTTDFTGPVNTGGKITAAGRDLLAEIDALKAGSAGNASKGGTAAGRDLLAEIDALKAGAAGNANKGGTDTNKAIEDLGKLAAQLLNSGNLTVPGGLKLGGQLTYKAGVWNTSDDGVNRLYFEPNASTLYQSQDKHIWRNKDGVVTMVLDKDGKINGRDILAELDKLNSKWEGDKLKAGEIEVARTIKLNEDLIFNNTGKGVSFRDRFGRTARMMGNCGLGCGPDDESIFIVAHAFNQVGQIIPGDEKVIYSIN